MVIFLECDDLKQVRYIPYVDWPLALVVEILLNKTVQTVWIGKPKIKHCFDLKQDYSYVYTGIYRNYVTNRVVGSVVLLVVYMFSGNL